MELASAGAKLKQQCLAERIFMAQPNQDNRIPSDPQRRCDNTTAEQEWTASAGETNQHGNVEETHMHSSSVSVTQAFLRWLSENPGAVDLQHCYTNETTPTL